MLELVAKMLDEALDRQRRMAHQHVRQHRQSLRRGDPVVVQGRLTVSTWTGRDGGAAVVPTYRVFTANAPA